LCERNTVVERSSESGWQAQVYGVVGVPEMFPVAPAIAFAIGARERGAHRRLGNITLVFSPRPARADGFGGPPVRPRPF